MEPLVLFVLIGMPKLITTGQGGFVVTTQIFS